MNKDEIRQTKNVPLEYKNAKQFFHCKNCLEQFIGSPLHEVMTPRDYGMYEIGMYEFTYPDDTKANIPVVWCKRCGKSVWDGRNLTKLY